MAQRRAAVEEGRTHVNIAMKLEWRYACVVPRRARRSVREGGERAARLARLAPRDGDAGMSRNDGIERGGFGDVDADGLSW